MIVAEHFAFVVGIDTHAKTHTLAIINTPAGGEIANETFPATSTGGRRALSWILRRTGMSPEEVLLSMEGTGSYGATLRQQASDAGFQVTEAPVPNQRLGRYQGKSDSMDAARAARAVLSIPMDRLREPRSGQNHMALRILSNARRTMARERTAAINALNALLRVVELGMDARKALTITQIQIIAAWRERDEEFGVQTLPTRSHTPREANPDPARTDGTEPRSTGDPRAASAAGCSGDLRHWSSASRNHPDRMVTPRKGALRGGFRRPRRDLPCPCIIRGHNTIPTEPRR
jgi:hypothetical protein